MCAFNRKERARIMGSIFTPDALFPKASSSRGLGRRSLLLEAATTTEGADASPLHDSSSHGDPTAILWFVFIALALGTACRSAFTVINSPVPYTVALLVIGICMGVLNDQFDLSGVGTSLDAFVHINPHLLLAVFLPALIFESSFSMEWHTLSKVLTKILILAGPGVLINMALTATVLHAFPFAWDWNFSMMVGSILAATDPVAVVSILKEVGASKILGHVIEGESLVNDGTAIVVFTLFFEISKGEHKTSLDVFLMFLTQPLGALLVGVIAGQLVIFWLKSIFRDHLVQITLTLFACYLTFMVAESVFHVSGVLACVSMGFYISAKGRVFFVGNIEHTMHHFWEVLTYCANTLVFVLTGFIIASEVMNDELELKFSDAGWGFLLYVLLNIIRFVTISILWIPMKWKTGYQMSRSEGFICVWGGLRGAIGLALGLVVLEEDVAFTARDRGLVLILISCAVVGTLLLNASTSALMLRVSGLLKAEKSQASALTAARRAIHERAMEHYEQTLGQTGAQYVGAPDFTAVKQLIPALRVVDDPQMDETEMEAIKIVEQDAFMREQNKNLLVQEIRRRFLHGVRSEAWKILEEDLCDAIVCSYIMEAGEFAEDEPPGTSLTDLDHLLRMLEPKAWRRKLNAFMESNQIGKKLLQGLRKLGVIEEPWMVVRRRMQALNAFCAVHERTSARFERLLLDSKEPAEEHKEAVVGDGGGGGGGDEPDSDHYLTQSSIHSLNQLTSNSLTSPVGRRKGSDQNKIGGANKASATGTGTHRGPSRRRVDAVQQLEAETTGSSSAAVQEHLRIVLKESNGECDKAKEMLKKMQHEHNHVARALRSEDLARETLEVVSHEIARLTRTGLLKQGEAAILSSEHAQVLRKLLSQPLRPSKTSPGRILAQTPIMDPTVRSGVTSRTLRTRIARETDVIEYSIGDVVVDPSKPLPEEGILLIGNGVLELRTVNDVPGDEPLVIGCKSHRAAWALTAYEEMCRDSRTGTFLHRSGIQAIAKAKMFGFIVPRSLAETIFSDEKERECLDSYRRAAVALLVESSLRRALSAVVSKTSWIEGGLRKFSPHRFAARGKFEKLGGSSQDSAASSSTTELRCDDPSKIIVLISGMARVEGVGIVIAPAVLDSRCVGIRGGTCGKSSVEAQGIGGSGTEGGGSSAEYRLGQSIPGIASSSSGMGTRKNSLANIFGLGSKQPSLLEPTPDAPPLRSQLSGLAAASSRSASMELTRTNSMSGGGGEEENSVKGNNEFASRRERITGRDAPISGNVFTGKWTPLGQVKLFVVSCGKLVKTNQSVGGGTVGEGNSGMGGSVGSPNNNSSKASTHQRTMEKLKSGSSTLHALFSDVSKSKKPPQHGGNHEGLSGVAHSASEAMQKDDGDHDNKRDDKEDAPKTLHITMGKEENSSDDPASSSFDMTKDRRKSLGDDSTFRKSHDGTLHSGSRNKTMVHSRSVEGIDGTAGQGVSNFSDDDGDDDEDVGEEHPLTHLTARF